MRWPFSLLFRGGRDAPAAADGPAGGESAPAGGQPDATPPPAPAAWRGLPPVQRAVGPVPLTAAARPFARALATRRAPDPILRPLAHDVAADGPAGLVSGIATPLAARPASAEPIVPGGAALPAGHAAAGGAGVAQRRGRTSSAAEPGGHGAAGASPGGAAGLPVIPARPLPVTAAAAPGLAATRVAEPSAPEPVRPVARATGPTVQRSVADADAAAPAILADGGSPASAGGSSPGPSASQVDGEPVGSALEESAPVQRRTLGASRRLGLGAPIPHRPQRPPAPPPDLALARPPAAPARVARAEAAPLPVLRQAASAAPPVAAIAASPGAGSTPGGSASSGAVPSAPAGPAGAAPAGEPAPPPRPLVGDPERRPAVAEGSAPAADEHGDVADAAGLPLAARLAGDGANVAVTPATQPSAGPLSLAPGESPAGSPGRHPAAPAGPSSTARPAATPTTAPLVVARAALGRPALRSSVAADRSAVPAVVVARRPVEAGVDPASRPASGSAVALAPGGAPMAVAGPGSVPAVPLGSAVPLPGLQRLAVEADGPRSPAPPAGAGSTARATGSSGGTAADGLLPLATAGAPEAGAGAPLPLAVARLATADTVTPGPAVAGPTLGWTPSGGFAPVAADAPAVQRTEAVTAGGSGADAASAGAAADGAPGGGPAAGPADYEEIADHVYDRIRARFATEILLDRERMGLLIDG